MTNETIRFGAKGQKVRKLQTMLKDRGYNLEADGNFGPKTRRAVTQYQRENRLQPNGVADKRTWHMLQSGQEKHPTILPATQETAPITAKGTTPTLSAVGTTGNGTIQPSGYTPSEDVTDAEDALDALEDSRPGEYESQYDEELERLYDQILGRPDFSYNLGADPMYQQYRQQYMAQGRLAMEDTMGRAAGLTGGYGSSYSQNVGQQAYGQYLQGLNDAVPELYALALNRYTAEGDALADRYAMVYDLEQRDRTRYNQDYDRWFKAYTEAKDTLEAIREEDYERYLDLLEAQEKAEKPSASGSSGGTEKSGSSGSKQTDKLSDFALRELAFLYMDAGFDAGFGSTGMLQWMRSQGIGENQDEAFYAQLRDLGYEPRKHSGGGGKPVMDRDNRLN